MAKKKKFNRTTKERVFYSGLSDVPPIPAAIYDMEWNNTGSWRYQKPIYEERIPPCTNECGTNNDIRLFIDQVTQKKYKDAFLTILKNNPFPSIIGRVCYHPCEGACNRTDFDQSVSVNAIERFIGDWALKKKISPKRKKKKKKKRVAIVGSGPAGLSCAFYLALEGYNVNIFEAFKSPGGMMRVGIPKYRLPKRILNAEIKRVTGLGVKIIKNKRVGVDFDFEELLEFDAAFLGIGAHGSRSMRVKDEEKYVKRTGLDFLREYNLDNKTKVKRRTAVIGGGNTAMDSARTLLRLGSKPIIVYRRSIAEMPAHPDEIEAVKEEGIEIIFLANPVKFKMKKGRLQGIDCIRMKLGELDKSGRRRPIPIKGSEFFLKVDEVLPAIGEVPDAKPFIGKMELDSDRWMKINEYFQTSIKGVFAGGDGATGMGTVTHAIGEGKKAAFYMDQYLRGKRKFKPYGTDGEIATDINFAYFEHYDRVDQKEIEAKSRKKNFHEVVKGLSESDAIYEANRCFSCGDCTLCDNCYIFCPDTAVDKLKDGYEIDYEHCKGCGLCVSECPRHAVSLIEEVGWKGKK